MALTSSTASADYHTLPDYMQYTDPKLTSITCLVPFDAISVLPGGLLRLAP